MSADSLSLVIVYAYPAGHGETGIEKAVFSFFLSVLFHLCSRMSV